MKYILLGIVFLFSIKSNAQNSLTELLNHYNTQSIPYIYVDELKSIQDSIILFDARERNEFEVSHIKNAKLVGSNHFTIASVTKQKLPKDTKIVVYCSLGVRSEDISEKLKSAGYTNIYNLYGGIFEWKNKDQTVVNSKGKVTEKVHVYSKHWAKWLLKGKKVY